MLSEKRKFLSRFFQEPFAASVPSLHVLDKTVTIFSRTFYIAIRIFLRIIIGKKKRETIKFYHKLYYRDTISFSFYLFMFCYRVIKLLRLGNPSLIKIHVP